MCEVFILSPTDLVDDHEVDAKAAEQQQPRLDAGSILIGGGLHRGSDRAGSSN